MRYSLKEFNDIKLNKKKQIYSKNSQYSQKELAKIKEIYFYLIIYLFFIIISLIITFLLKKINFLKLKKSDIYKNTYEEKYIDFMNDYERANPFTKKEGEMRYLDKLEEKNKINKEEKDKRKKKIKDDNSVMNYLKQRRLSRIQNIQGLNNILNKFENKNDNKNNINNVLIPIIKNYKKKEHIKKNKNKKIFNIETGSSIQSNYLMNQGRSSRNMLGITENKK